jgi:glycosyltransferase involved in cell wall biosynthesis
MFNVVNRIYRLAVSFQADFYHLHDPELLRIAVALGRSVVTARIIFDSHEDVPRQILSKEWIPPMLRNPVSSAIEMIEGRVVRRLAGVVAATPHIAKRFEGINSKTVDVNNYPMPNELISNPSSEISRKRQVCYVGGITHARGIRPLVEALPMIPDVTLVLCGQFQEPGFEAIIRALPGWRQVQYLGQTDREGVKRVLAESSAGIVTLLPTPAYIDALPVKMFEYMSAKLPVVASDFPLWRSIIENAGAGVCVNPESPSAISTAIRDLLSAPASIERMGNSGRNAVETEYNWPREARKLTSFYQSLC